MKREDYLKFCPVCTNRSFDLKYGITCSLTGQVADFEGDCQSYVEDEKEIEKNGKRKDLLRLEISKTINKGRIALFVIGGFYLYIGNLEAYNRVNSQNIFDIIDYIFAASFLGLAIWSYSKPYLSLFAGLVLFILLNMIVAFIDPRTIFKGIVWKIIIVYFLIYAINNAKEKNYKKH